MKYLPDRVVARLQTEMQLPDLSGTRYRAIRFVGRGGMGAVWLAEDSVLHRNVALKVLAAEDSSTDLGVRLLREARILGHLEHPGIVPVHDAGTLPDGRTFYCMKYVQGQTLDRHIARLDQRERLQLLQRIAEPLAFAHSRGIVHRDLKPGNIMVGAFGEVLILDWGLAKVTGSAGPWEAECSARAWGGDQAAPIGPEGSALPSPTDQTTAHGSVLGTAGFMAPEQARGEVHLIDHRTDVFALGAIMSYMLGHAPGATRGEMASRPLRAIVGKATAAAVSERYASVQELSRDIAAYLEGRSVTAYHEKILERAARLFKRHQVAVVLVLAYLLMRVLFLLFSRR
jgi:eukaryotic-like serine/threonine-protein kinase